MKIALNEVILAKKMQNFRALGAPPPDPRASGGWGLCPQTPSLRRLGVHPPDPPNSPPLQISSYAPARHCNLSKQTLKTYSCKNMIEKHKLITTIVFSYFFNFFFLFFNNKRFLLLPFSLFLPFSSPPLLFVCLLVCSQKKKKIRYY